MGKRKRLGLIYSADDQWIGGTYYTLNLIQSFKTLTDLQQPEIVVFSNLSDFKKLQVEVEYPYLAYEFLDERALPQWIRVINKITVLTLNRKIFIRRYSGKLDALFLLQHCGYLESIPMEKRLYWIPDFQDKHLPYFFSGDALKRKDDKSNWIAQNAKHLILSSNDVCNDLKTFYPNYKCYVNVVHFAVTHPPFKHLSIEKLRNSYNLPEIYFLSPNQFWAHKNHLVVIKAAQKLKESGVSIVIAFSGKENDNRNPGYTDSLKAYVDENQLNDVIRFLGFLDRADQLQLMNHSRAVIQPSRFEGWSTVIEDAMAMNKFVIASNLEVNKEQLGDNALYFGVDDSVELSKHLLSLIDKTPSVEYDYRNKIKAFATGINEVIKFF